MRSVCGPLRRSRRSRICSSMGRENRLYPESSLLVSRKLTGNRPIPSDGAPTFSIGSTTWARYHNSGRLSSRYHGNLPPCPFSSRGATFWARLCWPRHRIAMHCEIATSLFGPNALGQRTPTAVSQNNPPAVRSASPVVPGCCHGECPKGFHFPRILASPGSAAASISTGRLARSRFPG